MEKGVVLSGVTRKNILAYLSSEKGKVLSLCHNYALCVCVCVCV